MHRLAARPVALVIAAVAVGAGAGCGGAPPPTPSHARAAGPCRAAVRDAVARAAGTATAAVRVRTTDVSPGQATCVYTAGGLRVEVRVDSNPQAAVRFARAVVERDQVSVWAHRRRQAPRLVQGIGQGADWFPADAELLTTDGRRLVSVVVHSALAPGARFRLGRAVAGVMVARPR